MSRRPVYPDKKLVNFQVKVAECDLDRLRELAKSQGKKYSSLAREFICAKLDDAA